MVITERSPATQWLQVCGLASVQAAITLCWVIYGIFLPDLLKQFNFPADFAVPILVIENALAIFTEPLMGGLSDRSQSWLTSRWPFISFGVISASGLFIAIPCVVIFGNPLTMQWLLPIVLVLWALAMTVFRSPAMCLLGIYAFGTNLPAAASILSIAGGLAGSLRPLSNKFILSLGAGAAFTIGSVVLLGAAGILRFVSQKYVAPSIEISDTDRQKQRAILSLLAILLVVGLSIGLSVRLTLGEILPKIFKAELGGLNLGLLLGMVSISLGAAALPGGWLATKIANRLVMLGCLLFGLICLGLLLITHGAIATGLVVTCLVFCFGIILNGTIPLGLELMPANRGGLGVGMYFGGFSAAICLFSFMVPKPALMINLGSGTAIAAIALVVAMLGIGISGVLPPTKINLATK